MACMVTAKDGMVVSTLDPEAMELRSHVIEWLMTNHPHDCPVCDEGGECQLQEMTIAGGHGIAATAAPKRTYLNQDLGPFIVHEMNRCIACYRCVRTYRDYCGGTDFGVFGSRDRVYFGRVSDGTLESPFAGNLVDVCPTGVFTDKTFRFKSRAWDLQEAPSICPHCSLGCATVPGGRFREVQRVRAGINPEVNGFFICDRGRFGGGFSNRPGAAPPAARRWPAPGHGLRPSKRCATGWRRSSVQHGPDSVALLGSPRASLEANALLHAWAADLGTPHLVFEAHAERDRAARLAAARLGNKACSLADIRSSDLVVLVGADPLAEGPLLALAVRQAVRSGGRVVVIDPRPVALPCRFTHLPLPADQLGEALRCLAGAPAEGLPADRAGAPRRTAQAVGRRPSPGAGRRQRPARQSRRRAPVRHGRGPVDARTPRRASCCCSPGRTASAAHCSPAAGRISTPCSTACSRDESAPWSAWRATRSASARDPGRARAALGHLDLLVALDATPTLAVRHADLVLPTRSCFESRRHLRQQRGAPAGLRQGSGTGAAPAPDQPGGPPATHLYQ